MVLLEITGEEAAEILQGLVTRKQRITDKSREINDLGQRVGRVFEMYFGWYPNVWERIKEEPDVLRL